MKPRDYCCCAIPTVNVGIYATLTEQLVLGILVGVLSLSTPAIVGAATPAFAPWIFGVVCLVAGGFQILGFIAVAKEKPILYRRYVSLHSTATLAVFAIAAAWIIVSASRHSTAKSKCIEDFFSTGDPTSAAASEGNILCNIFPWVDVGIMGGLWVLLAIIQGYLYIVVSSYGSSQRRDHKKYDSLYDPTNTLTDNIPMNNRNDPWDSRPSTDSLHDPIHNRGYNHVRQDSIASVSDVLDQPLQQPKDQFSHPPDYGYQQSSYPPYSQGYLDRKASKGNVLPPPDHAYTQDPGPTPKYSDTFYSGPAAALDRPVDSQAHPGEF